MAMHFPTPLDTHPDLDSKCLHVKTIRKCANNYLYQQGETARTLYRIRTGVVSLESVNERGQRCIIHLLGRGAVLGHEIFLQQPRNFDARVCTDATIEAISLSSGIESILGVSLMRWANAAALNLLQEAAGFKVELHRAQAGDKVLLLLEQLQKLHPEQTDACWLPSRCEMADLLDMNHATASRVVAKLFKEGALHRAASKDFVRVDWGRIRRLRASG